MDDSPAEVKEACPATPRHSLMSRDGDGEPESERVSQLLVMASEMRSDTASPLRCRARKWKDGTVHSDSFVANRFVKHLKEHRSLTTSEAVAAGEDMRQAGLIVPLTSTGEFESSKDLYRFNQTLLPSSSDRPMDSNSELDTDAAPSPSPSSQSRRAPSPSTPTTPRNTLKTPRELIAELTPEKVGATDTPNHTLIDPQAIDPEAILAAAAAAGADGAQSSSKERRSLRRKEKRKSRSKKRRKSKDDGKLKKSKDRTSMFAGRTPRAPTRSAGTSDSPRLSAAEKKLTYPVVNDAEDDQQSSDNSPAGASLNDQVTERFSALETLARLSPTFNGDQGLPERSQTPPLLSRRHMQHLNGGRNSSAPSTQKRRSAALASPRRNASNGTYNALRDLQTEFAIKSSPTIKRPIKSPLITAKPVDSSKASTLQALESAPTMVTRIRTDSAATDYTSVSSTQCSTPISLMSENHSPSNQELNSRATNSSDVKHSSDNSIDDFSHSADVADVLLHGRSQDRCSASEEEPVAGLCADDSGAKSTECAQAPDISDVTAVELRTNDSNMTSAEPRVSDSDVTAVEARTDDSDVTAVELRTCDSDMTAVDRYEDDLDAESTECIQAPVDSVMIAIEPPADDSDVTAAEPHDTSSDLTKAEPRVDGPDMPAAEPRVGDSDMTAAELREDDSDVGEAELCEDDSDMVAGDSCADDLDAKSPESIRALLDSVMIAVELPADGSGTTAVEPPASDSDTTAVEPRAGDSDMTAAELHLKESDVGEVENRENESDVTAAELRGDDLDAPVDSVMIAVEPRVSDSDVTAAEPLAGDSDMTAAKPRVSDFGMTPFEFLADDSVITDVELSADDSDLPYLEALRARSSPPPDISRSSPSLSTTTVSSKLVVTVDAPTTPDVLPSTEASVIVSQPAERTMEPPRRSVDHDSGTVALVPTIDDFAFEIEASTSARPSASSMSTLSTTSSTSVEHVASVTDGPVTSAAQSSATSATTLPATSVGGVSPTPALSDSAASAGSNSMACTETDSSEVHRISSTSASSAGTELSRLSASSSTSLREPVANAKAQGVVSEPTAEPSLSFESAPGSGSHLNLSKSVSEYSHSSNSAKAAPLGISHSFSLPASSSEITKPPSNPDMPTTRTPSVDLEQFPTLPPSDVFAVPKPKSAKFATSSSRRSRRKAAKSDADAWTMEALSAGSTATPLPSPAKAPKKSLKVTSKGFRRKLQRRFSISFSRSKSEQKEEIRSQAASIFPPSTLPKKSATANSGKPAKSGALRAKSARFFYSPPPMSSSRDSPQTEAKKPESPPSSANDGFKPETVINPGPVNPSSLKDISENSVTDHPAGPLPSPLLRIQTVDTISPLLSSRGAPRPPSPTARDLNSPRHSLPTRSASSGGVPPLSLSAYPAPRRSLGALAPPASATSSPVRVAGKAPVSPRSSVTRRKRSKEQRPPRSFSPFPRRRRKRHQSADYSKAPMLADLRGTPASTSVNLANALAAAAAAAAASSSPTSSPSSHLFRKSPASSAATGGGGRPRRASELAFLHNSPILAAASRIGGDADAELDKARADIASSAAAGFQSSPPSTSPSGRGRSARERMSRLRKVKTDGNANGASEAWDPATERKELPPLPPKESPPVTPRTRRSISLGRRKKAPKSHSLGGRKKASRGHRRQASSPLGPKPRSSPRLSSRSEVFGKSPKLAAKLQDAGQSMLNAELMRDFGIKSGSRVLMLRSNGAWERGWRVHLITAAGIQCKRGTRMEKVIPLTEINTYVKLEMPDASSPVGDDTYADPPPLSRSRRSSSITLSPLRRERSSDPGTGSAAALSPRSSSSPTDTLVAPGAGAGSGGGRSHLRSNSIALYVSTSETRLLFMRQLLFSPKTHDVCDVIAKGSPENIAMFLPTFAAQLAQSPFMFARENQRMVDALKARVDSNSFLSQCVHIFKVSAPAKVRAALKSIKTRDDPAKVFGELMDVDPNTALGREFLVAGYQSAFHPFQDRQLKSMTIERVFQSNTKPFLLRLAFQGPKRKHGPLTDRVMFKKGDDVRVDVACLQVFQLLNKIWLDKRVNYQGQIVNARVYECAAFSADSGFIQYVPNCLPLKKLGRMEQFSQEQKRRLLVTTAGSYVAAWMMGVGDRHDGNTLIMQNGTLFHIDFSYVLGDRVAVDAGDFAITKDLKVALDEYWDDFVAKCIEAFTVLREHQNLITEFAVSVLGHLFPPERLHKHLNDAFMSNLDLGKAAARFREIIKRAPGSYRTRLKNILHAAAQKSKGGPQRQEVFRWNSMLRETPG